MVFIYVSGYSSMWYIATQTIWIVQCSRLHNWFPTNRNARYLWIHIDTYIPFVYYINVMSVYCFSTDGDPNCLFSVTFNFWNENSAFFLCFSICILIFLWNNVWRWWKFKCKCGKQSELVGVTIANISHWFYSFSHLPPTSWHS